MKTNIPWEKYALITELAEQLKDRSPQFGKTVLQKMVYLLQELYGVNCGYTFDLYMYGPFSSGLLQDLDLVESMGGVSVVPVVFGTGGYRILPGEHSESLKKKATDFLSDEKITSALNMLVEDFGNYQAKELELRSTIIYVSKDMRRSGNPVSRLDLLRIVKEIKPKFTDAEVQQAIDEMEKRGHISFQ